jgi:2'-5' RNA ligase
VPLLLAIDVALLPPADVTQTAIDINRSLEQEGFQGLRLDADHLPHITLSQQFVRESRLEDVKRAVAECAGLHPAPTVRALGAGRSGGTVWLTIDRTPALVSLHRAVMDALAPLEERGGTAAAFAGGDPRPGDLKWVSTFRESASFASFTPHITLGHSTKTPEVAPMEFVAPRMAICHLGRFCTCRSILAEWRLA